MWTIVHNCPQLWTTVQVKTIVNNCGYQLKTIGQFQGFYKSCLGAEVESWSSYALCFFDTYRARKTKRSKKRIRIIFFNAYRARKTKRSKKRIRSFFLTRVALRTRRRPGSPPRSMTHEKANGADCPRWPSEGATAPQASPRVGCFMWFGDCSHSVLISRLMFKTIGRCSQPIRYQILSIRNPWSL